MSSTKKDFNYIIDTQFRCREMKENNSIVYD